LNDAGVDPTSALCSSGDTNIGREMIIDGAGIMGSGVNVSLQAMTNDCDLNMGNNIKMRDTQFFGMFWPKTLENQMKCQ
jgi:hypothetical protein